MCVCTCRSAGAVSLALLPDWLTQTPASRKRHRWSSLSAHVARFSVILNTPTHKHTDKHPSLFSSSLARRIAPCLTVHPLPGPVRFMSCPGFHFKETACWPICMQSPPTFPLPLALLLKVQASSWGTVTCHPPPTNSSSSVWGQV